MKSIKISKTKDFKSTFEIIKSLPEFFTKEALKNFKKERSKLEIYGIFTKSKMLGFATYKKFNPDVVELYMIAVAKGVQSKGIGKLLLKESLKKISKKFKICKIKTLAETARSAGYTRTRKFYEKIGFMSVEIIDPYPGWDKGNPCQIFVKFLKKK